MEEDTTNFEASQSVVNNPADLSGEDSSEKREIGQFVYVFPICLWAALLGRFVQHRIYNYNEIFAFTFPLFQEMKQFGV